MVAAAATNYFAVGGYGTSQNNANVVPLAGTFKNLYVATGKSPTAGQGYTVTLMSGTQGSLTSTVTSPTCVITNTATTCNDTSNTLALTAGQYWALKVVSTASAAQSDYVTFGLEFDPQ